MKRTLLFAAFLFALTLQTAQAEVALVIGNDAYSSNTFQKLDKAVSDAHTIADKLRSLGYDVIKKSDLTLSQMNDVVREFHDRLKTDNKVGVFYYAGHAIQVKGNNYLIPLGVNIERDYEAETRAFLADEVLNAMLDAKTKINIIILDACRDNTLTKRGGKRGLATMSKENTFILFSTQMDKTAEDGTFVKYLKNWIDQPNLTIDEMARKVRNEVRDATKKDQIPAYENNLNGDFMFNPIEPLCKDPGTCPPQSFAGIRFVKIKKGCFMMGSPENEEHRDDDEEPQHKVCIEKDFWLSDTEITQEQWIKEYGYTNSMFKTATRPVEKVSWDDVQDFIKKLNSKKEGHFRLPSEAEWEYSARAGTTDAFFTGKCITVNQANYDGGSLNPFDEFKGCNTVSRTGVSPGLTNMVHGYSPNNWGLYDMVGNVWEWVEDCWDDNYHHTPINGAAMETGDCTRHTIRGGSWNSFPADIRSAARTPAYHDTKLEWIGFRIARDL